VRPIDLAWIFLPQELLPLLVIVMAMLSIVGLVRPSRVYGVLLLIAVMPILSLIIEEVLAALPWYVGVLLLVGLTTNVVRLVLELFLGKEAAGHVLGHATIATFKGLFYLIGLPVRGVVALARRLTRGAQGRLPRI